MTSGLDEVECVVLPAGTTRPPSSPVGMLWVKIGVASAAARGQVLELPLELAGDGPDPQVRLR